MSRTTSLALAASFCLPFACGGDGDAVEAARFFYAKGNLERAEASLGGLANADGAALSIRIRARRDGRDVLAQRIAELARIEAGQAMAELDRLAFDADDPVAREWVELALSETYDRLAAGGRPEHRTVHPTGYRPEELAENEIAGEPPVVVRHGRFDEPAPRDERGRRPRSSVAGASASAGRASREPSANPTEAAGGGGAAAPEADAQPERSADLLVAAERWIEKAFAVRPGAQRRAFIARARGLERRHRLREEVAAGRSAEPVLFAERCDISAAGPEGLIVGGDFLTWEALSLPALEEAARLSRLSGEAELGLFDERLLRSDESRGEELLAELPRLVERELLREEEAWDLVARVRAEELPDDGYVFDDGRWLGRVEYERTRLAARIEELEAALERARAAEREKAFEALDSLGEPSRPALVRALDARMERAIGDLGRGKTLRSLERLAERRRVLDSRREFALELIFDTDEYFYPYRTPDVPWEKAKLYPEVQARVDGLVAVVREAWEPGRAVSLSRVFRGGAQELAWVLERFAQVEVDREWPAELPEWLFAVETRLERLTLHDFAWTPEEREALARNRAVVALNERNWASDSWPDEQRAAKSERVQVEITNAYRVMFGRRALAWNPNIQAAAVMHSDYMANTGDFGHFEPDPERHAPRDRMRLCGYPSGVGENCHAGSGDPGGAHAGWIRSSGHHRNILSPGHHEMATSQRGRYWTQNFGTGRAFETDLDKWQD
ncbi:MAG: hypothetical protein CMJ84_01465 [Planctomycetes bacterium]|jgi:uncharacterized protein YkwD|nr:hypothetical protein [Planctomycetota bacterium]MDP6409617.1 CAP domain-containing protein [Planctomycetota bacterium]